MNRYVAAAACGLALPAAACAGPRSPPVPAAGPTQVARELAGEWAGEYVGDVGRGGSISFILTAHGDTARGAVVMIPRGRLQPLEPVRGQAAGDAHGSRPETLTIQFVRLGSGRVDGSLAPYRDPECACTLYTSLEGRLENDSLSGRFTSLNAATGAIRQAGTWKVTRRLRPPA